MSGPKPAAGGSTPQPITILLVDDIAETRENIRKLLAFEGDMKVVGGASTGREGVAMARDLKPDIIIMDINMPDMDGLEATSIINKAVPQSAVIIMSVQDEMDYLRRAMNAGARDFIPKPVSPEDLINAIRKVYRDHEPIRRQYELQQFTTPEQAARKAAQVEGSPDDRSGFVIVVYSPQGGTGVTTISTSLATLLMNKGVRVLMADADLQFGDVSTFFDVKPQATIVELMPDADDMDPEHFDNIISTHATGLKVLAAPSRPELADEVTAKPGAYAKILDRVRKNYDYVVVDTSTTIDDTTLSLFDIANLIVLVTVPSLPSVKNTRFVIDVLDKLGTARSKQVVVLNKVYSERERKNSSLPTERIQSFLKREIAVEIPVVDERILMAATLRGVPITVAERDRSKPPIKQYVDLSKALIAALNTKEGEDGDLAPTKANGNKDKDKKPGGLFRF